MDALIASVQSMAKTADEAGRKKLIDALNNLALSIESPQDSMQRLLYLVGAAPSPFPAERWSDRTAARLHRCRPCRV